MKSVLDKAWFQKAVEGKAKFLENEDLRIVAGLVVGLIEIREAIEDRASVLAAGQMVIAKEIADAIRENTAVQKTIAERAGTIEEQGVKMLAGFDEIREDLEAMQRSQDSQRNIVSELIKTAGDYAAQLDAIDARVQRLAEEKQDKTVIQRRLEGDLSV